MADDGMRERARQQIETFEDHMDLWVTCKKCSKVYHTSLFMSDYTRWRESGSLPKYLSDNGRSLLTKGICHLCEEVS